ncbi:MAG: hypothetical protein D4R65_05735 [Verrucomicrobiaceae bacterium]|nr:MAG: hypothetical protein D4R65_05735 [Verrucomicrobiaceae bacterium]
MKKTASLTAWGLVLTLASTFAALDIVETNAGSEGPVYVLKNTFTGKVLGTFWDRANEKSDYGFESSIVPDFLWSNDRDYVAVTGGASRSRVVSLYKVTGNSLKEIPVPQLDEQQASPLSEITDSVAEGVDPVRWQQDGTLLLHFWVADRVHSESEEQKTANVWADLDVSGSTAKIVGTSSEEPSAQAPDSLPPNPAPPSGETLASAGDSQGAPGVDPGILAGTHNVSGRNPDGTEYKGTVEIRVKNGLLLMQWKIGKDISHGTGILVGMTLGVALDSGLAIYQIFGQSEGQSLIGYWSGEGSTATNEEAILIRNADMEHASFEAQNINGKYISLREVEDGQIEGNVTISGRDIAKNVLWKVSGKSSKCQGLALGDGLAIISPGGLSVFTKNGDSLEGQSVTGSGKIKQETLIPAQ